MAPTPKAKATRQRWAKRPEIGVVAADQTEKAVIPTPPTGLLPASKRRWRAYGA